jgi:hypothetical protein
MITIPRDDASQHLNVQPAKRLIELISQTSQEESLQQIVSGAFNPSNVLDDASQDENRNSHVLYSGVQISGVHEVFPCPDIPEALASPCNITSLCKLKPSDPIGHHKEYHLFLNDANTHQQHFN